MEQDVKAEPSTVPSQHNDSAVGPAIHIKPPTGSSAIGLQVCSCAIVDSARLEICTVIIVVQVPKHVAMPFRVGAMQSPETICAAITTLLTVKIA